MLFLMPLLSVKNQIALNYKKTILQKVGKVGMISEDLLLSTPSEYQVLMDG